MSASALAIYAHETKPDERHHDEDHNQLHLKSLRYQPRTRSASNLMPWEFINNAGQFARRTSDVSSRGAEITPRGGNAAFAGGVRTVD
jgi:hypothetical protein